MSAFAVCDAIPSSAHQFHVACLFHSLHGRRGSSFVTDFCWCALYAHFLHNLSSVKGLQWNCYVESPRFFLVHPDMGLSLVGAEQSSS